MSSAESVKESSSEFLARLGIAPQPRKEALERVIDGAQSVLQGMDGSGLKPIHLRPQHGQFPRLQDVVEASPTPKITTLLKAEVVDIPARANPLDERSVLRSVGFGNVTVGAMNQHLASSQ